MNEYDYKSVMSVTKLIRTSQKVFVAEEEWAIKIWISGIPGGPYGNQPTILECLQ